MFIGVDIGGTKMRAGLVEDDGTLLCSKTANSCMDRDGDVVFEKLSDLIYNLEGLNEAKGIGIGVPGILDPKTSRISLGANVSALINYPLKEKLEKKFGLPVFIENDANVAGLAESYAGAGRGYDSMCYMTISTGVGGVSIVDGKVLKGSHGYAGEMGNLITNPGAVSENIMNDGALENEISGTALSKKARYLFQNPKVDAAAFFEKVKEGDEKAQALLEHFVDQLSSAMSMISMITDPAVFVFGGGVMQSSDLFLSDLEKAYQEKVYPGQKDTPIVLASLDEPGLIGAAMICKSEGL
jgi:glucokinase